MHFTRFIYQLSKTMKNYFEDQSKAEKKDKILENTIVKYLQKNFPKEKTGE